MKVYSRMNKMVVCLGPDELWTFKLADGKQLPEKQARAIVADYKALRQSKPFWCR